MSATPAAGHLGGEEIRALKLAAHRQLTRWAKKPTLSPHQHAQRIALKRAARVLQDPALADGCELPRSQPRGSMVTPDGWRKIERGLFESADGQWRITNPWKLNVRHEAPCERR
ncbi:MAG: hypothetical protein LC790_13495 [Actinobacteria bacterium]|nr:hypothetical protein [Actinomycetota bacterium]